MLSTERMAARGFFVKNKNENRFRIEKVRKVCYNLRTIFGFERGKQNECKRAVSYQAQGRDPAVCKTNAGQASYGKRCLPLFLEKGEKIGTATVYRQLEYMVQEGVLHKYVLDAGTPACFEYAEQPTRHEQCVHCKCTSCGKLIHLHCGEVAALGGHITQAHGFQLDTARTVLYGTCAECKKSASSAGEDEHDHVVCEEH